MKYERSSNKSTLPLRSPRPFLGLAQSTSKMTTAATTYNLTLVHMIAGAYVARLSVAARTHNWLCVSSYVMICDTIYSDTHEQTHL